MKKHLIAAAAACALMAGSAYAEGITTEQEMAVRGYMAEATEASGEVIPGEDTQNWNVGASVPDTYEVVVFEGVDEMADYGYLRDSRDTIYIVDQDRRIVHMMPLDRATTAGGEAIPPAGNSDNADVAQPTN